MVGQRPWLPGLIDDREISTHVATIAGDAPSSFAPFRLPRIDRATNGVSPSLRRQ
jgi:hypothetical protein